MQQKKFRDITTALIVLFNIIAGFGSLIADAVKHSHVWPTFLWIISSTALSVSRFGYSRSTRSKYIKVIDALGITVNIVLFALYLLYNF